MKSSVTTPKTNNAVACTPTFPSTSHDYASITLDALLPEQFYVLAKDSHERWNGARSLMLAVLQEAVQSYVKYSSARTQRGQRLFTETRAWFWSHDQDYLFSFECICSHLQLDPDYIRRGLELRIRPAPVCQEALRATYRRAAASHHRVRIAQAA